MRDFCFVDNVVQALILAGTREKGFAGEAFNVAQGAAHSLLQCKALLKEIAGQTLLQAQRRMQDASLWRRDAFPGQPRSALYFLCVLL